MQGLTGILSLRKHVTSQEWRNTKLAASNTALRKQVTKMQARERDLKKRNDSLEKELAVKWVSCAATEVEVKSHLK